MNYKIIFIYILINLYEKSKSNYTSNNNSYDAALEILNKEKVIDKYYLNLTNVSKTFLEDIKFAYSGKIIYLNKYSKLDILKDNIANYRIKWIFMFDSMKEINNYVNILQNRKNEYFSNVIIITKDLYESNITSFDYLADLRLYIFYLKNETFYDIILKYDYTKNNIYIYSRILSQNNKEYNLTHLYILVYSCLIILLFCVNFIKYGLNLDPRNSTFFFIRTIYFFPVIKIPIILLIIMKLNSLQIYNDLFNIGKAITISFLSNSLNILYKSLFVTFSVEISNGIDTVLGINTHPEFLNFTTKFIFVYFLYNTSLINNKYMFIENKYLIFISLGFESFIFFIIYKKYKKAKNNLMHELRMVILYCNEYINSINIKLKMILWQGRMYFLYYIGIVFLNIITNILEIKDIDKEIYFHFIEVLIIFSYCLIYKPRKWPDNFDVYFKNEFHYFDNIFYYKINLDNITDNNNQILTLKEEDDSDNEIKQLKSSETIKLRNKSNNLKKYYKKNSNYPIIVINPKFYFNISKGINQDIYSNIIKNSDIGFKSND